jgi:Uma2 family endonuclease
MAMTLFPDAVVTGELAERLRLPADVERWELVEGELRALSPNNRQHAKMATRLSRLLDTRFPNDWSVLVGDPGFYTARRPMRPRDTIRGPDLIVISVGREAQSDPERAFLTVAPEYVIEIISPSNTEEELDRKVAEYRAAGVDHIWIVDIDARIWRDGEGRILDAVILPGGATLTHADLFD